MTVRLRPHHLLCSLTYAGQGYSPAFIANFDALVERLKNGELVEIAEGPDDICQPLAGDATAHCHDDSVLARDRQAAIDLAALTGLSLGAGAVVKIDAALFAKMRDHFRSGRSRQACVGCEWHALCTGISSDFKSASWIGTTVA